MLPKAIHRAINRVTEERVDMMPVVGVGARVLWGLPTRPWKTFELPDPAGARIGRILITLDARSYAYGYVHVLEELYMVEGLK